MARKFYDNKILRFASHLDKTLTNFNFTEAQFCAQCHGNSYIVDFRGKTIWVKVVWDIMFECIAIYCHITICDLILVKRHFIWEYRF